MWNPNRPAIRVSSVLKSAVDPLVAWANKAWTHIQFFIDELPVVVSDRIRLVELSRSAAEQ